MVRVLSNTSHAIKIESNWLSDAQECSLRERPGQAPPATEDRCDRSLSRAVRGNHDWDKPVSFSRSRAKRAPLVTGLAAWFSSSDLNVHI
jgi:hypothetical protein